MPPTINNTQFEQAEEDWNHKYGGGQRRAAFIRAGTVDYKMTGLSQKDMDFISAAASKKKSSTKSTHPPGMMDKSSTEANAKVGEKSSWADDVAQDGRLRAEADQPTRVALRHRYDDRTEDIRPRDEAAERADLIAVAPF